MSLATTELVGTPGFYEIFNRTAQQHGKMINLTSVAGGNAIRETDGVPEIAYVKAFRVLEIEQAVKMLSDRDIAGATRFSFCTIIYIEKLEDAT